MRLLKSTLNRGKIVDRMRVNHTLGNLAATADQLVSLSAVELSAYLIRDQLRSEIDLDFAQEKKSTEDYNGKPKFGLRKAS